MRILVQNKLLLAEVPLQRLPILHLVTSSAQSSSWARPWGPHWLPHPTTPAYRI